ncbi:MAG: COX15/CtaA family protein [Phycisphaerales bacterium]
MSPLSATVAKAAMLASFAAEPGAADAPSALRSLIAFVIVLVVGLPLLFGWARMVRPMHLALGFAATALLWVLGYVALLQPGLAVGELLFGLMLAVLFGAGFVAGRYGDGDVRPMTVGLVSAIANLLVVGAFLRDEQHGSTWTPIAWVVGLVAVSMALAHLGGATGRRFRSTRALPSAVTLFAAVTATTVFLLIVLGGVLTGEEAGLAVPDWPNSFGHNMLLYPVSEMKGGVFYEHAHRLYGMLVGATSAVLVVIVWKGTRMSWLRGLAVALLCMICVQGLLGGMRVTGRPTLEVDRSLLAPSTALAIVHGVFAQIVFAASLVIAAGTTRLYSSTTRPFASSWSALDRRLAMWLPPVALMQLILGALYRHLQTPGGATAPGHPMWAINLHMTMAIVVVGMVAIACGRAWIHAAHPVLVRLAQVIATLVSIQLVLGVMAVAAVWTRKGAVIPAFELTVTTLHQGVGALILGASTLFACWSRRLLANETTTDGVIEMKPDARDAAPSEPAEVLHAR